ncbi:MAG TPA: GNAT family N-acetyltransferase [Gemmatimonadales bacterium]|nr:GNAT family N-acetyltransferase [Gemmatimonadales bacterium]
MSDTTASTNLDAIPLHQMPGEQVVARWDGTEVLEIRQEASEALRTIAERVAVRAMRDTPFHHPAYTVAEADPETRVYIAREGGKAVGLAVLRPRTRWGWWSWDDYDAERRPATGVAPMTSWTVESIWTHAANQQRGLAKRLLDVAAARLEQPIESFAWRRPFTPSGEAFVRRHCPEGFWVPD